MQPLFCKDYVLTSRCFRIFVLCHPVATGGVLTAYSPLTFEKCDWVIYCVKIQIQKRAVPYTYTTYINRYIQCV